jgi:mannose-6-phosphate isomerase-like protein (cupin superfamily)
VNLRSLDGTEPFTTKDGSTIRELHHTPAQSLAEATLEPGQATERHYHRRTEEIYFVTKGSGELEVDGETSRVRPGDAILIPPGAWHTLENNGTSELLILCMCSPPYSDDDTYFE